MLNCNEREAEAIRRLAQFGVFTVPLFFNTVRDPCRKNFTALFFIRAPPSACFVFRVRDQCPVNVFSSFVEYFNVP